MKKEFLAILTILFLFLSCSGQDCDTIPSSFNSYDSATRKIQNSTFKYYDRFETTRSTWIKGSAYYSCDGHTGFLLLRTKKETYIHSDVPTKIWNQFKSSSSLGAFYNSNLKNKYPTILKNED